MIESNNHMKKLVLKSDQIYQMNDDERKKLQHELLLIYQDIALCCERHELCVMLGGGSALGAVRHKGFIPWDDDLDVMMPRCDYDSFLKLFLIEFGNKYVLHAPNIAGIKKIIYKIS